MGEGLGSCTIEELQEIEQQLERSVSNVRARKVDLKPNVVRHFSIESDSNSLIFTIWIFNLLFVFCLILQTQVFKEQIEQLKEKVNCRNKKL